jgi:predicted dehydrogenase
MKVLIVGLGSIGRRHLANLRALEPTAHITVWHQHTKRGTELEDDPLIDSIVFHLDDALNTKPDIALITSPASLHVEAALSLARHGIHLFIEKPLSNTLHNVNILLELCQKSSLVLMVGYCFRFYKPLQILQQAVLDEKIGRLMFLRIEVGQFLPTWRPEKDYRKSVSARTDLGGGAVLELSHELDYARWIAGEIAAVSAWIGRLSDLEIDVEDTAEIILHFRNGAVGSVHLDMVQQPAIRTCRVIGTRGTLFWDWSCHRVQLFSDTSKSCMDLHPTAELDRNQMLKEELNHFLSCVKNHAGPIVNGMEGRRVLEIALAVKQSSQEGRVIAL